MPGKAAINSEKPVSELVASLWSKDDEERYPSFQSGKIARAKPALRAKITERLLSIDKTGQKHKDLIKAGAIESFGEYFGDSEDKEKILVFVRQQLNGESPKTCKIAKQFLERWGD